MDEQATSWESWIQNVGGGVIDKWATATYQQPYEVQKLRIQALGENGYYSEGQPGTVASAQRQGFALTPGVMLLAGAAVLAVVLLKD